LDLHHKILWIYKISKDFMNFKDSLKRNDYNTLSIIIFSIHTLISYFIFMRDRERGKRGGREGRKDMRERDGEKERRERREKRETKTQGRKEMRERKEKREERMDKKEIINF